ncbi:MAG TPA: response regulator [Vicinamibacterales bacterium]|nr:response regulator [Vicinamibacterales bacterium]
MDDHRGMLETVSAMLADDFDVAGIATSGTQAVETARQLDPDAIVLDINMPGLDGFQTFRALERAGSRAPVVFLSMFDLQEHVSEAFRCGGRGYVLKSRAARDLAGALDQALHGRLFVPSLPSLFEAINGGGHAMQLYGAESFLDALAGFFDLALRRGDATCVIATPEIREGLGSRLRDRGWDVGGPSGHRRHLVIDAADALDRIMRDGLPDATRLAEIAAELDQHRLAVTEAATSRMTIFGNMVVSLSAEGNAKAVIALENLWNRLTHALPFFTLCGYSTSCFHAGVPDLWSSACAQHDAVGHASDV